MASKRKPEVEIHDLTPELWREYHWWNGTGFVTYRITDPQGLVLGKTTHRVIDLDGVVHCVPSVGVMGCVVRWKSKNPKKPVQF